MPTTRAMARKGGSTTADDKENVVFTTLRKKSVRSKATAARTEIVDSTVDGRPCQAADGAPSTHPFSVLAPKAMQQRRQHGRTVSPESVVVTSKPGVGSGASGGLSPEVVAETSRSRSSRSTTPARPRTITRLQDQQPEAVTVRTPSVDGRAAVRAIAAADRSQRLRTDSSVTYADRATQGHRTDRASPLDGPRTVQSTRRSLAGTPLQDKKLIMPPSAQWLTPGSSSIDIVVVSDDELCGPKTPLHRKAATGSTSGLKACDHPDRFPDSALRGLSSSLTGSAPAGQTLTPQLAMLPAQTGSHTYAASLEPGDASASQRPFPTKRQSNVQYVFYPLNKASRIHSPLRGRYDWPVTPSDDEESDPMDDVVSVTSSSKPRVGRSTTPGSRRGDPSTSEFYARDRLQQVFASTFGDSSDSDSVDEDDDVDVPAFRRLEARPSTEDMDCAAFVPSDESENAMDVEQTIDGTIVAETAYLDQNAVLPMPHGGIGSSMTAEDDSLLTPRLLSGLIDHTSSRYASSPSIPLASTAITLSSDDELDSTISLWLPISQSPQYETPRLDSRSLATRSEALLLKTPHMRSALDQFDEQCGVDDAARDAPTLSNTTCIDPSVLSQFGSDVVSTRKDSVQVSTSDLALHSARKSSSGSKPDGSRLSLRAGAEHTGRLSMLLDVNALVETPESEVDEWLYASGNGKARSRRQHLPTPDFSPCASPSSGSSDEPDDSAIDDSVIHHHTGRRLNLTYPAMKELFDDPHDHTPHYALPTLAYDARRKSMPVVAHGTPQIRWGTIRHTDTHHQKGLVVSHDSVKNGNAPAAAHRQSLSSVTPLAARVQALPSSLPRLSIPSRRRDSTSMLCQSVTALQKEALSNPRPRSYTPSQALTSLRLGSTVKEATGNRNRACPLTMTPPRRAHALLSPAKASADPMFTPHPTAPLRGIVAYVEIYTRAGSSASTSFVAALHRLGARTSKTLTDKCTHVVFKDGSPATTAKLRVCHREGLDVFVVNSRWVTDCDQLGKRMPELGEEYRVDVHGPDTVAAAVVGRRSRRKSMEPVVLTNGRGHGGRSSVAGSAWGQSPMKKMQAGRIGGGVEDGEDESWLEATPRPVLDELVVPDTMPVSRVRKLDFGVVGKRRLTAWEEH